MYVELLSGALDRWNNDLTGEALLDHVLTCRAAMVEAGCRPGASAYSTLAAEVAYDLALINLCCAHGIPADASAFDAPRAGRRRMEQLLADAGTDLASLARRRTAGRSD